VPTLLPAADAKRGSLQRLVAEAVDALQPYLITVNEQHVAVALHPDALPDRQALLRAYVHALLLAMPIQDRKGMSQAACAEWVRYAAWLCAVYVQLTECDFLRTAAAHDCRPEGGLGQFLTAVAAAGWDTTRVRISSPSSSVWFAAPGVSDAPQLRRHVD
jgi:hypothetical protein